MTDTKRLTEGGAIDLVKLLPLKESERVVVTTDFELFKWKIYPNLAKAMKVLPKAFHISYNAKNSSVDVAANRRFHDVGVEAAAKGSEQTSEEDDDEGPEDDVEPHGNDYIVEVYPVTVEEFKEHFENNDTLLETPPTLNVPSPQLIEIAPGCMIDHSMLDFYKKTRLPELLASPPSTSTSAPGSPQQPSSLVCLAVLKNTEKMSDS